MQKFILSCESTCDLPFNYLQEKNVSVIFYNYTIDGVEYEDQENIKIYLRSVSH